MVAIKDFLSNLSGGEEYRGEIKENVVYLGSYPSSVNYERTRIAISQTGCIIYVLIHFLFNFVRLLFGC